MSEKFRKTVFGRYLSVLELVFKTKIFSMVLLFLVVPYLFISSIGKKIGDMEVLNRSFDHIRLLFEYFKDTPVNEFVGIGIVLFILIPLIFYTIIALLYWVFLEIILFIKVSILKKDKNEEIEILLFKIDKRMKKIENDTENEKQLQKLADKINEKIKGEN